MPKLTPDDLEDAVNDLGMIPFFPRESRASVMRELAKMMPNLPALRWTVETAVAHCRQWPGMAEIRGLLCSRFSPADRIDQPYCTIPGFTAEENEAKYLEQHEEIKQRELSGSAKQFLQLAKPMRQL